jgi:hypothetical protein
VSKQKTTRAKTSRSLPVFIADTSSTTGGGLSGVTHASSGLVLEYRRQNQSTWTSVTAVSKTLGTYVSGGIVADGSLDGAYEVDFPDAAFASSAGAEWVALRIRGVANMLPVLIEIELDAVDYQDAAAFGLSKLADIETDTQNLQSRIPAALVGGRMDSYLGATANNVITHNTLASNAIGNSQLATSAVNAIQSGLATSTQATAIETDTQNIQSRLPTALVDGRMAANAQVVGDKEGYKLASDGLALVAAWTVGITGNITGNVTGSVGSISGVTFPSHFGALVITAGGAIDQVVSVSVVDELGESALSANSLQDEIANAVAATQALSRLDSMIESDGTGQFRFDTIALENAPAGGGGGGTDWTANERTAIRAILGVPTSGTTPTDPTSGILDTIRDSLPGTQTINVYPVSASTPERVAGTTLTFYRDESRSVSVVTDFTLTSLTLQFTVEDQDGNDVYTLANASINRSNQTFTLPVTTAVTGGNGQYRWSMRDITGGGNSVIAMGVLTVQEAASNG